MFLLSLFCAQEVVGGPMVGWAGCHAGQVVQVDWNSRSGLCPTHPDFIDIHVTSFDLLVIIVPLYR